MQLRERYKTGVSALVSLPPSHGHPTTHSMALGFCSGGILTETQVSKYWSRGKWVETGREGGKAWGGG